MVLLRKLFINNSYRIRVHAITNILVLRLHKKEFVCVENKDNEY